ncbi:MAG TPA: acylphosphatase [Woeseiaceae bacterium]|jgi:acylphosphatase|nr:acylphosphatase [Woeseiaceae bacterium]
MSRARLFTIKGRVQGVFFRDSTRRVAQSLGLTGHAINLSNGDVEVLACGDEAAIRKLAEWLHEGPRMAEVAEVIERDAGVADVRGFATG